MNRSQQLGGFSFGFLWSVALNLSQTDPRNPSLYHPHDNQSRISLTYDACVAAVGPDYTQYDRRDVYDRVLLWRIPLIALVATTTLPALGFHTKVFTILHLIASPIDTLWSLFYKLDLARRHADWVREKNAESLFTFKPESTSRPSSVSSPPGSDSSVAPQEDAEEPLERFLAPRGRVKTGLAINQAQQDKETILRQSGNVAHNAAIDQYDLDVIALIINSYQEWHLGKIAKSTILYSFRTELPLDKREIFRSCCASAAAYLAADRVSRILPSFVATLIFFTQLFAGFWKTLINVGHNPDPANFASTNINRTPHNIAFGALYFWLPFAVLATAIVGGAQTENSVPRILNRLRNDTHIIFRHQAGQELSMLPDLDFSMSKRRIAGGLPIWQPDKFQDWNNGHVKFFLTSLMLSGLIVLIPTVAAVWISWHTPSEGFGCRSLTQVSFFCAWSISHWIDLVLTLAFREPQEHGAVRHQGIYWFTFIKDLALTVGAVTMLTYSSIGLFNSCNCWTKWYPEHSGGLRYLSFPQEQLVFDIIRDRLKFDFAIVTTLAFGIELTIFFMVWIYFRRGHRVLKQRDIDGILSEDSWWEKPIKKVQGIFTKRKSRLGSPRLPPRPRITTRASNLTRKGKAKMTTHQNPGDDIHNEWHQLLDRSSNPPKTTGFRRADTLLMEAGMPST